MEVKAISGDITKLPLGAIIVNLFEGVKSPAGATGAVDKALGGAITQLISDGEIKEAIVHLMEKAHTLAEGAGAAALAGAIKMRDQLQGKRVVVVVSGGNISIPQLKEILQGAQERAVTSMMDGNDKVAV